MQRKLPTHKIVSWLKVISLGLMLGLGIQYALAWISPTAAPPNGNVSGPITVGSVAQYKSGKLGINSATIPINALEVGGGGSVFIGGNIAAGGKITAPRFCIGVDCRNAWPQPAAAGVTSLSAGTGVTLSPNPITTTGSISVDTGAIQKRVTGTCASGGIKSINADGTVTCGS